MPKPKPLPFLPKKFRLGRKTTVVFHVTTTAVWRALYAATRKGLSLPGNSFAATNNWLSNPAGWKQNKGDPGFSDKRLANIQFASALLAAIETDSRGAKPRRRFGTVYRFAARSLRHDSGAVVAWQLDGNHTAIGRRKLPAANFHDLTLLATR
jgi:hypothetical protein